MIINIHFGGFPFRTPTDCSPYCTLRHQTKMGRQRKGSLRGGTIENKSHLIPKDNGNKEKQYERWAIINWLASSRRELAGANGKRGRVPRFRMVSSRIMDAWEYWEETFMPDASNNARLERKVNVAVTSDFVEQIFCWFEMKARKWRRTVINPVPCFYFLFALAWRHFHLTESIRPLPN